MELKEIAKNIFHIKFSTQEELTSTFLRFQEFFESPEFRGKVFTLEEYKKWYVDNSPEGKRTGEFTYYTDWNGFNIPSTVLEPFYNGDFDPLSEREKEFLALFRERKGERFYIIGTHGKNEKQLLKHEIAHGLFYTNPEYKKEVLEILKKISSEKREEINMFFQKSGGYHSEVWDDETHAYGLCSLEKLEKNKIDISDLLGIREELNLIFERYQGMTNF